MKEISLKKSRVYSLYYCNYTNTCYFNEQEHILKTRIDLNNIINKELQFHTAKLTLKDETIYVIKDLDDETCNKLTN